MSSKYKPFEKELPHFITFTVVGWVDAFTRENYREIFLDSLKYCQQHKGLILHAWVIMSNHVHLIISSEVQEISDLARDIKKYCSKKIIKAIQDSFIESRKEWMLNLFRYSGLCNNKNKEFQFWKNNYHPIVLNNPDRMMQRINYLHNNPVKAGLVWQPWHYKYSSAIDYFTNGKGLLEVHLLN